ncbi:MAG: DUF302 domain-containing protein [Hyphomicrobiales bacterium]
MTYHLTAMAKGEFDEVCDRVIAELKKEGFGVLTEIDVKATLKAKLDIDFRPYRILGACNPPLAHQVLEAEDKVGVLLPCNVVVQDRGNGKIEVSAMDPAAAMSVVDNVEKISVIAGAVRDRLQRVVDAVAA